MSNNSRSNSPALHRETSTISNKSTISAGPSNSSETNNLQNNQTFSQSSSNVTLLKRPSRLRTLGHAFTSRFKSKFRNNSSMVSNASTLVNDRGVSSYGGSSTPLYAGNHFEVFDENSPSNSTSEGSSLPSVSKCSIKIQSASYADRKYKVQHISSVGEVITNFGNEQTDNAAVYLIELLDKSNYRMTFLNKDMFP